MCLNYRRPSSPVLLLVLVVSWLCCSGLLRCQCDALPNASYRKCTSPKIMPTPAFVVI